MNIPKQSEKWVVIHKPFSELGCNTCSYDRKNCGHLPCIIHTEYEDAVHFMRLIEILEVKV